MSLCCSRTVRNICERLGFLDPKKPEIEQEEVLDRLKNVGLAVGRPWAAVDQREYWGFYARCSVRLHPMIDDQLKDLRRALQSFKEEQIKPGVAIDLGCGNTPVVPFLLNRGWTVWATDSSKQALKHLSGRIAEMAPDRVKNARLVCVEMERFKFPEKVKLIFARNSLVYCNPQKIGGVWDKAYEALEPGGRIVGNFFPHPISSQVEANAVEEMGVWFTEEVVVRGLLHRKPYKIESCKTTPRYHEFFCEPRSIDFIGKKEL